MKHLTLRRLFHAVRCHVTFFCVAAVVAAAFYFFCAQARERVRSGSQLDGTVVPVAAWCCVLPLLLLLKVFVAALVTVHLLLVVVVEFVAWTVVGFLLLVVDCADLL